MNHFEKANKSIGVLCSVYEKRISDLENKLKELALAAEWRDECEWFYDGPKHFARLSGAGWHDIYLYENCRKADAETTYQAALKASKERL